MVEHLLPWRTPYRIRMLAYAGTGKTTTLAALARRHSDKRVLYLAGEGGL